jgi:hypothetical protein
MAWSAEKLVMLGVGALGAYAVYRLVTAPKDQAPLGAASPQFPAKKASADVSTLPVAPGPVGTPPVTLPLASSTTGLHMTTGLMYRGRFEATPGARPEEVLAQIRSLGFDSIILWASAAEAAPNVPGFALENPGRGTRWFHAIWRGPTADVPRPREVVALWIATQAPVRP